ncbi:hypothetical protein GCM10007420_26850 [Glycocaulis albus]|uniref:Uncharacterized protein n=1 Tax=Glycocaulis albus TaxID=1382801 RepID=A0ABQ1Y0M3_9PROT|nr:hypothetical protein GCM10007420_26850 [Glycocaulis albus]
MNEYVFTQYGRYTGMVWLSHTYNVDLVSGSGECTRLLDDASIPCSRIRHKSDNLHELSPFPLPRLQLQPVQPPQWEGHSVDTHGQRQKQGAAFLASASWSGA